MGALALGMKGGKIGSEGSGAGRMGTGTGGGVVLLPLEIGLYQI